VAIFYTVFHPTEGTKVLHQVPSGSIIPPTAEDYCDTVTGQLFDFDLIKNYVIPKAPLCDRLIVLKVGQYRVLGYPVSITGQHYARNSFSFNFCFVFNYMDDSIPYESCIRRLGRLFKNLEEQYQILSKKEQDKIYFKNDNSTNPNDPNSIENEESLSKRSHSVDSNFNNSASLNVYSQILKDITNDTNSSTPIGFNDDDRNEKQLHSIHDLIQQIFQDLSNYSECLIPVDSGNSVDIKLLPVLPPPPRINPEDVPISTVNLKSIVDVNWDPTMLKILPYINGINSVKRISLLTNSGYWVVKNCIQHLMHYKCIIITDIFQFSNIYAPTSQIDLFLKDVHMSSECQAYVVAAETFRDLPYESDSTEPGSGRTKPDAPNASRKKGINSFVSLLGSNSDTNKRSVILPSKSKLFYLYRSLHQGQTIKQWYKDHQKDLEYIDIRRFIIFGVLRGLIYRIHTFPIIDAVLQKDHAQLSELFTQNYSLNETTRPSNRVNQKSLTEVEKKQVEKIVELLLEIKSVDAICTELNLDRKSVDSLLRKVGHYNTINC
jgi:hypothetical protein